MRKNETKNLLLLISLFLFSCGTVKNDANTIFNDIDFVPALHFPGNKEKIKQFITGTSPKNMNEEEGKKFIKDFKIIKLKNRELVASFCFDFYNRIFGKCILTANHKNNKWVIQNLYIAKRGSDNPEDGLLVYTKSQNICKVKNNK